MKKILISFLMALPLMASAQDNTWERVEEAPASKESRDAKYLVENAVPEKDGKVCFETTIEAPGKSAGEIYNILLSQLTKMTKEPNQIERSFVAIKDSVNHKLGAIFQEWLVFKSAALSLDRTEFNYQIICECFDGKANVSLGRIVYLYEAERDPQKYLAEEWITDQYCVNKKHTKLLPISGKFRRKTIDRKDFIFTKFKSLLNDK